MSLNLSNKNIVDDDNIFFEINSPEKYTSINLSHNLLTILPKDLSIFKSLQSLNISYNKFTDYNLISQSLSTLPLLQDLTIDLATQENVLIILNALPGLITLNGQFTAENNTTMQQSFISNDNNNKKNEISLNEETKEFEFIYKEINNDKFNKKFQKKLREEINKINNNLDISNKLYNAIIIKSKLEIYSFILDEVINIIIQNDFSIIKNNKNNEQYIQIINLVKDKLKYNQNLLFEIIMNENNNNNKHCTYISSIFENEKEKEKNNNIKLNNNNNSLYEIKNEISITDSLLPYYDDIKNISKNKINIMPKISLISLLDEIYEYNLKNKEKNNLINFKESIIPFLTSKYGIKSIATFWYNNIIEGIDYYFNEDKEDKYSEIFLIKKILEKNLDEYFYIKYKRMKKKYIDYINKINNLVENEKNIKENINYEDGIKLLIDNMDEICDNKNVIIDEVVNYFNIIKDKLNENNDNNEEGVMNILGKYFVNILLEIQIKNREKQYNIFLNNFKIYDKDDDGFINKEEFIELIYSFQNDYIINNNKIITSLCSELFKQNKLYISINESIEILSKTNIHTKDIFDILLSFI